MKKSIFLFVVILLSFFSITSANEDGNEETNDITIEENLKAIISLQSIVGDYRQD
ncbi:MAG: hypothetical protein LBC61_01480 [Candidatus Peribacteria bacterium]|jgi:hypothetical protein|nr:hypothetical protein [Candidatus Peribacteria bacterium]